MPEWYMIISLHTQHNLYNPPTHPHRQKNMHHHQTCGYYKNLVILELKKLFDLMIIHNELEIHVF